VAADQHDDRIITMEHREQPYNRASSINVLRSHLGEVREMF
jgi:hypothetical protein